MEKQYRHKKDYTANYINPSLFSFHPITDVIGSSGGKQLAV
jgi:hypothetical protein